MKKEIYSEEQRLFDQVHAECCQCKVARRKISETMRRIRSWFNKEFNAEETIPKEFRQYYSSNENECPNERLNRMWCKYL